MTGKILLPKEIVKVLDSLKEKEWNNHSIISKMESGFLLGSDSKLHTLSDYFNDRGKKESERHPDYLMKALVYGYEEKPEKSIEDLKFISKEVVCKEMNWVDFRVGLNNLDTSSLQKIGVSQYTNKNFKHDNYTLVIETEDGEVSHEKFNLESFLIFSKTMREYRKISPVVRIIDCYTDAPYDCDPMDFSCGSHETETVGFLVK